MEREKHLDPSEILWDKLSGKRVILAGISNHQKESFWQSLRYKSSRMGEAFEVSDDLAEAGENDYVFLFAGMGQGSELSGLLEELKILAQKKVASAVLVSDNRVYGKVFGAEHKLSEHELGYACHTSAEDQVITAMRMAEHLAWRMAGEGAPVRIVRADDGPGCDDAKSVSGGQAESGALVTVLEAAVEVLLYGTPGEVYNLPMQAKGQTRVHSPLSPMYVVTDAAKLETILVQ